MVIPPRKVAAAKYIANHPPGSRQQRRHAARIALRDAPPAGPPVEHTLPPPPAPVLGRDRARALAEQVQAAGFVPIPIGPGKKPCCKWGRWVDAAPADPTEPLDAVDRADAVCGIGMVTGAVPNIVVLDADTEEDLEELLDAVTIGGHAAVWHTQTSRGGHVFFRYPSEWTEAQRRLLTTGAHFRFELPTGHAFEADLRGHGGYVLSPGSLHRSGHIYEGHGCCGATNWPWRASDRAELPELDPAWIVTPNCRGSNPWRGTLQQLIDRKTHRSPYVEHEQLKDVYPAPAAHRHVPASAEARDLAMRYLARAAPAVEGMDGSRQAWIVCMALVRGYLLPPEEALQMLAGWNARCSPPWSEEELRHKLEGAMEARKPPGYLLHQPEYICAPAPDSGERGADVAAAVDTELTHRSRIMPSSPALRTWLAGMGDAATHKGIRKALRRAALCGRGYQKVTCGECRKEEARHPFAAGNYACPHCGARDLQARAAWAADRWPDRCYVAVLPAADDSVAAAKRVCDAALREMPHQAKRTRRFIFPGGCVFVSDNYDGNWLRVMGAAGWQPRPMTGRAAAALVHERMWQRVRRIHDRCMRRDPALCEDGWLTHLVPSTAGRAGGELFPWPSPAQLREAQKARAEAEGTALPLLSACCRAPHEYQLVDAQTGRTSEVALKPWNKTAFRRWLEEAPAVVACAPPAT